MLAPRPVRVRTRLVSAPLVSSAVKLLMSALCAARTRCCNERAPAIRVSALKLGRRFVQAIWLMVQGARLQAFRNLKSIFTPGSCSLTAFKLTQVCT